MEGIDRKKYESILKDVSGPISFLSDNEKPDLQKVIQVISSNFMQSVTVKGKFKGCLLAPAFSTTSAQWQYESWIPKEEDVLIVTYPKTGTTWMREVVRHLFNKGNDNYMKISKTVSHSFCYLESSNEFVYDIYNKLPLKRRLYATHLLTECLDMEKIKRSGCKILYIMRNPKDTLVSWYHFIHSLPEKHLEIWKEVFPKDWSQFFETFVTGQQADSCKSGEWYPHHILSWYQYRNDKNVKFLYYEDMKKNPAKKFEEISEFLGCSRTKEEILEIVKETSFDSMKKVDGFEKVFFRKGMIGDWKNHFTVAQSKIMDEKFNAVLSETDLHFKYE